MDRKLRNIILILLAVVLLGVGVWQGLRFVRKQEAARELLAAQVLQERLLDAQRKHRAVQKTRQIMRDNADRSVVQVLEDGREALSLSLAELGLLDSLYASIDRQFTTTDLLPEKDFARLSPEEQLAWAEVPQPGQRTAAVDAAALNIDELLAALSGPDRVPPQDAVLVFEQSQFRVLDSINGNTIDPMLLTQALTQQVSAYSITDMAPGTFTFDLTTADCYLRPSTTRENTDFDFAAALQARIDAAEITVHIGDEICTLSGDVISGLLSLAPDGRLEIQEAQLRELLAQWGESFQRLDVPFVMDSYVDGPVEVHFLRCSYLLDENALFEGLEAALMALENEDVTADFLCVDSEDNPFGLGDTYVEVDLTNQVMVFYKDGQLITATDIVSGCHVLSATPQGLYQARNPATNCVLSGEDYEVFSKYWIGLTEDNFIGLHDGSWRSYFGGNRYIYGGSHGCVNTPEEPMRLIYENIELGTPVLVYHHRRPEGAVERPIYIVDDSPALEDAYTTRVAEMERTADSPVEPPLLPDYEPLASVPPPEALPDDPDSFWGKRRT